jgi:hypothetical protein
MGTPTDGHRESVPAVRIRAHNLHGRPAMLGAHRVEKLHTRSCSARCFLCLTWWFWAMCIRVLYQAYMHALTWAMHTDVILLDAICLCNVMVFCHLHTCNIACIHARTTAFDTYQYCFARCFFFQWSNGHVLTLSVTIPGTFSCAWHVSDTHTPSQT